MNNARYLRECDYARTKMWIQNFLMDDVRKLGGYMLAAGSTIRYRRALNLFDTYRIRTKVGRTSIKWLIIYEKIHYTVELL